MDESEPPGPPLLDSFPDRETWDRCLDATSSGLDPEDLTCRPALMAALALPPMDRTRGFSLVSSLGSASFVRAPPGWEAIVVSWAAHLEDGSDPTPIERDAIEVLAVAQVAFLGSPRMVEEDSVDRRVDVSVRAQTRALRQLEALGEFADPGAYPPRAIAHPFTEPSVVLEAERSLRASVPFTPEHPLAHLVATIRRGETPEASTWWEPGAAGLGALELGRRGDWQDLPTLVTVAADGPSSSDRIAALYAALRVAGDAESLARWADTVEVVVPGAQEVVAHARAMEAEG
jgi:hypothetical protein